MTWNGVILTDEQREVVDLVESVVPSLPDASVDETPDSSAGARAALAESGVWSIGMDDEIGGGGAPRDLLAIALVALGAHGQASFAWACAQAHAAIEVLAAQGETDALRDELVEATRGVAVVDGSDARVHHDVDGPTRVDRIDAADAEPIVVVLDGASSAWIVPPAGVRRGDTLDRTGFAGALTASVDLDPSAAVRVEGVDADEIRSRLRASAAAIAAGIALAAADASAEYSASRIQFGGPITALPTVRASLAQQRARALGMHRAVMDAVDTSSTWAGALLLDACEGAIETATAAIQSHGGYGYLSEYGVERLLRDAVSLRAATSAIEAAASEADRFAPAASEGASR